MVAKDELLPLFCAAPPAPTTTVYVKPVFIVNTFSAATFAPDKEPTTFER
jgi:hypothetical protein